MFDVKHHISELREQGYTLVKNANDKQTVDTLLCKIKKVVDKKLSDPQYPLGDFGYISHLQNEDVFFVKSMFSHPIVREILMDVLNDKYYRAIPEDKPNYIFRVMKTRVNEKKPLHMHLDSFIPSSGEYPWSMQVSMILEDQNLDNGCTLVVPGSHLSDEYAPQSSRQDAIPIISEAGDIVIWDGRIWHGTSPNPQNNSRLVLWAGFTRWWIKQRFEITQMLPDDIYQQLTDEERSIMGFCAIPPIDEFDPRNNNDTKSGYEVLPETATSKAVC